MACDVSYNDFINQLLVFENWHLQECMLAAYYYFDFISMPIYKESVLTDPYNRKIITDFEYFRYSRLVLIEPSHAVAAYNNVVYDPKGFRSMGIDFDLYSIVVLVRQNHE